MGLKIYKVPPSSSPAKDAGLSIEFERFDSKMKASDTGSNPVGGIKFFKNIKRDKIRN